MISTIHGITAKSTNVIMPRFHAPLISSDLRPIELKIETPAQPMTHKMMQQIKV